MNLIHLIRSLRTALAPDLYYEHRRQKERAEELSLRWREACDQISRLSRELAEAKAAHPEAEWHQRLVSALTTAERERDESRSQLTAQEAKTKAWQEVAEAAGHQRDTARALSRISETTCARCLDHKWCPWREDGEGYICAGCLALERDKACAELAESRAAFETLSQQVSESRHIGPPSVISTLQSKIRNQRCAIADLHRLLDHTRIDFHNSIVRRIDAQHKTRFAIVLGTQAYRDAEECRRVLRYLRGMMPGDAAYGGNLYLDAPDIAEIDAALSQSATQPPGGAPSCETRADVADVGGVGGVQANPGASGELGAARSEADGSNGGGKAGE